jgi:hypothetical protein
MSNKIVSIFILLLVFLFSCKSPNENEIPLLSPDMSQPIATGIYITNANGPDPIGIWGNPSDGSSATSVGYPILDIHSGNIIDTNSSLNHVSAVSPNPTVLPKTIKLQNPYPNPFEGVCVINYSLPVSSNVLLYVVPARWYGKNSDDINSSAGAITAAPKRTAIAILVREAQAAGMYVCQWRARDQNGNSLPSGFYRIYLRVNDTICWHDVFLYNEITDLPNGIRY